jgi:hypothetical protein
MQKGNDIVTKTEDDSLTAPSDSPRQQQSSPPDRRRYRWLVISLLLVAAVGALAVKEKYRFIAKRWGVVEVGAIYRSGQLSKWVVEETLTKHNIRVIVDLNPILPDNEHQRKEIEVAQKHGLEIVRLPLVGDGTGNIEHYATAIETLIACKQQHKPVLIHCAAGAQRTGGIVACYRLLVQKWPAGQAYDELTRHGWKPRTDQTLITYVNGHMSQLAERLVEKGILDRVPQPLPLLAP